MWKSGNEILSIFSTLSFRATGGPEHLLNEQSINRRPVFTILQYKNEDWFDLKVTNWFSNLLLQPIPNFGSNKDNFFFFFF